MRLTWGGLETEAVGAWDRLAEQVRAWPGTSIISHEILSTASPMQIDRAMTSFGEGVEVHLIVSVRDLVRQVPGGVAGERQAPQPRLLRPLPRDDPRPRPRHQDRLVVLGRAGDPRHPRPLGRDPAARAGAPGHRAASRLGARRAVAALQPHLRPRRPRPRPHPRARQPVARRPRDGPAAADQQAGHAGRGPARLPPAGARAARPPDAVAAYVERPPRPPARHPRVGPGPVALVDRGGRAARVRRRGRPRRPPRRPVGDLHRPRHGARPTTCCRPRWTRSRRCSSRAPGCASRRPTSPASSRRPATSCTSPGVRPRSGPSRRSRPVRPGAGRWAPTGWARRRQH